MDGGKHEPFPGSNLYTLLLLTNLSLSFSPPLLLFLLGDLPFVRISCPLWALTPIRAYLQETDGVGGHSLAPPNCWKLHIESPPPHRGPPGNLPPLAMRPLCAHISLKKQTLPYLLALSLIHVSMFSLTLSLSRSLVWGRMGDSVLCPPPQRGRICPISSCLSGYRRRRQCKKNDPSQCLTVKHIGLETIVYNKQTNGLVYKAKWNSTVLNEDVFALRHY